MDIVFNQQLKSFLDSLLKKGWYVTHVNSKNYGKLSTAKVLKLIDPASKEEQSISFKKGHNTGSIFFKNKETSKFHEKVHDIAYDRFMAGNSFKSDIDASF